jgi:hypothetical protein
VADLDQNRRTERLDPLLQHVAATAGTVYVFVFGQLLADTPGMREVQAGDGAHPCAAGYSVLADLLATLEHLDHGRLTNDEDLPPFVTISLQPGP